MSDNWFTEGTEEFLDESQKNGGSSNGGGGSSFNRHSIHRFYIPQGQKDEEKKVIMLNDDPIGCHMHHYPYPLYSNNWGNWIACPKKTLGSKRCPLCDHDKDFYPNWIGHYTILNVTGYSYTDNDGDEHHRMPLQILPAREPVVKKLNRVRDKNGGRLHAGLFEVVRFSDNSNIGDEWDFQDEEGNNGFIDLDGFLDEYLEHIKPSLDWMPEEYGFWTEDEEGNREYQLKPLPLKKVLEPVPPDEMAKIVFEGEHEGGGFEYGDNDETPDKSESSDDSGGGKFSPY